MTFEGKFGRISTDKDYDAFFDNDCVIGNNVKKQEVREFTGLCEQIIDSNQGNQVLEEKIQELKNAINAISDSEIRTKAYEKTSNLLVNLSENPENAQDGFMQSYLGEMNELKPSLCNLIISLCLFILPGILYAPIYIVKHNRINKVTNVLNTIGLYSSTKPLEQEESRGSRIKGVRVT